MRRLSIIALTLSAIVLLTHILFDLHTFMPGLVARIILSVFNFVLLFAAFHLYSERKERLTKDH